jgi:uncharacterized protein
MRNEGIFRHATLFLINLLVVGNVITIAPDAQAGHKEGVEAYRKGNYKTALSELTPLADEGDAEAQYYLALCYDNGRGAPRDFKAAAKWYLKSAEKQYPASEYGLGMMYFEGRGVQQDINAAVKWFQRSAEQGYGDAQYFLGFLHYKGKGVPQSYPLAAAWFRKAVLQGNEGSLYYLGMMYEYGQGIPEDYKISADLYQQAADRGNANALYRLGMMYYYGKGVHADPMQTHKWLSLAEKAGIKEAQEYRREIEKKMTPQEIESARLMANVWSSNHK